MSCRRAVLLLIAISFSANAFAKCLPPDPRKIVSTRKVLEKTVPNGVEVYDRVWLKNPTATEFITFTPEKGASERTGYRELLGNIPTTKDELPGMKLVNGERYEYHYPANPYYPDGRNAAQGGWVRQDYPAGLLVNTEPVVPLPIAEAIFAGKSKIFLMKKSVPYYYGKKKGVIDVVFEFTRNPRYMIVDPACPPASPTPSPTGI